MSPEELVLANLALATKAARYTGGKVARFDDEFAEREADARLGLVDAAQRYDPERGAAFTTFAWHRIIGAIRDGKRVRDHVTRWDRAHGVDRPPVASLSSLPNMADGEPDALYRDREAEWQFDDLLDELDRQSKRDWILDNVQRLGPTQEYLVRAMLNNRRQVDVARERGITDSAVSISFAAATNTLRKLWREYCGQFEAA